MDLKNVGFTENELIELNIHDLRDVARQIGVQRPTTKKKEDLVAETLSIIYGTPIVKSAKSSAGRPVREKTKKSKNLEIKG